MIDKDKFLRFNTSMFTFILLCAVTLGCGLFSSKKKVSFDIQDGCAYLKEEGVKSYKEYKDVCGGDKHVVGKDTEIVKKYTQKSYQIHYGIHKSRIELGVDIDDTVINEDYEHIKSEYVKAAEKLFQRTLGIPMPEEAVKYIKETEQEGTGGMPFNKEIETPKYGKVKIESISQYHVGFKRFQLDIRIPKYSS